MTVNEVAAKINRTNKAVYQMIKEKRGVGAVFVRRAGQGWFAYAKDVQKFVKDGAS